MELLACWWREITEQLADEGVDARHDGRRAAGAVILLQVAVIYISDAIVNVHDGFT